MPVRVRWLDEDKKDIVQYDFEGRWTWEEFYPEYEKALEMEKAQPHRVDVIMDFSKNLTVPPNALTHIKGITDRQPDNIGLSIFVTTNRFIQMMADMAFKFYPKAKEYFVVTPTMDEAHQMILRDREVSPDDA